MAVISEYTISILQQYGALGIFISLIAEFLGFPVPGETAMAFLGYLCWKQGGYSILISLLSAAAGTFTGSMLAYFIGLRYGEAAILRFGKYVHITEKSINGTKRLFDRYGVPLVVFSRFILGVRHVVPYLCGISNFKPLHYILYNLLGSFLWCSFFLGMGFAVGDKWDLVETLARTYSLEIILLIAFIYIVYRYFSKHSRTILAIALPLFLFIKLCEDLVEKELTVFDSSIYAYVSRLISEDMTDLMRFLSFVGSGVSLALLAAAGVLLLRKSKTYSFYGYMLAANLAASAVLNETFKLIFHRARPDILRLAHASGFSFPSGHSMIGISFFGFIIYICLVNIRSRWKYPAAMLLACLVLAIGISRIYLGVHYASDVAAGFSAGLAWLAVFVTLIESFRRSGYGKLAGRQY